MRTALIGRSMRTRLVACFVPLSSMIALLKRPSMHSDVIPWQLCNDVLSFNYSVCEDVLKGSYSVQNDLHSETINL